MVSEWVISEWMIKWLNNKSLSTDAKFRINLAFECVTILALLGSQGSQSPSKLLCFNVVCFIFSLQFVWFLCGFLVSVSSVFSLRCYEMNCEHNETRTEDIKMCTLPYTRECPNPSQECRTLSYTRDNVLFEFNNPVLRTVVWHVAKQITATVIWVSIRLYTTFQSSTLHHDSQNHWVCSCEPCVTTTLLHDVLPPNSTKKKGC